MSCWSTNLQGELWPLRAPLQGLLGVVELWYHWVPLLGKAIRRDKVREALQRTKLFSSGLQKELKQDFVPLFISCFNFVPAVQETEEIHWRGTGIVGTSKGRAQQWQSFSVMVHKAVLPVSYLDWVLALLGHTGVVWVRRRSQLILLSIRDHYGCELVALIGKEQLGSLGVERSSQLWVQVH